MMDESKMNWAQRLRIPEIKVPKGLFTFYLAHPSASRKYVREWELKFEGKHANIALINPFYDVAGEGREDVAARDKGEKFEKLPGYEWRLTQRDYIAICYSRGFLAIVDENSERSIGTIMEMVMARALAKSPKLLICTNKDLVNHPWLVTHFHKIYPSFEAFEKDVERQVAKVKKEWGF